jgi:hypothetical protein
MRSLIVQSAAGQSEQERLQAELDKLRDELQAETEMSSEHKAALAEIQAAKELAVAELAEAQAAVADAATLQAAKLQEIEQAHKIEKQAALDAHDKERQSIIQSLQAKISEKESETERIERELQETTLKFQDAEQSAAALDALAPLEEQVAKLTEELRVAGKAKLDAENKVQRLQTDKRLAEEGIQRQSSSLDKHAHALKMENTGLLEENSRLKAELDAAERSRVEREASHVRSRERTAELATEHADEVGVLKTEREAFEKQAVDAQAALDSASASHQAALQQAAEQAESARADLAKQLTEMDAELSAAQKILSKNTTELTALKEAHSAEVSSLRQKLESLAAASSAEEELRKQHSEAVAARAQMSDELARAIAARNDDAAAHAQELKDLQEAQASILETARQQAATQAEEAQLAFGQHEAAMRQEHEDTVAALRQECEKSATQAVERESKLLQVEQAVLALKQASAEWSDERADWVRKHSAEQVGCASARAQLSAAQQTIQDLQASKDEELAELREHMRQTVLESEQQTQTQMQTQAEKIAELEASLASLAADQAAEIEPAPTPLPVSHSIFQDKIAELEAANATQAARIGQLEATLADSQPEPEPEPEPAPTHQEASPPTPAVGAHKVAETCKTCGQLIGIGAETGKWLQQELNEKEREIEELRTQIRKNEADKEHEKLVQAERTKGNDIIGTGTTRREATARSGLSGRPGEGQEPPPPPAEQPVRNRPGAGGRAGSSGAAPHESITPPSTRGGPAASAPTDQHASGSRVALQKLEAMGFSGAAAEQALQASGGDLRAAVTRLTRG